MTRKRMTERFPQLLPLRRAQRKACFYLAMRLDSDTYASQRSGRLLPYEIYSSRQMMINRASGFDLQYQYNKVHNLKLAAARMNGLLIRPGQTFSFCLSVRGADRDTPYRDGLSLVNGKICGEYGGGLCQLSNLLYWLFLHSQLTVTERHGHESEDIPPADQDMPAGTDATVAEGWLDLRAKNETAHTFQLFVDFDGEEICGHLLSDAPRVFDYEIFNPERRYVRRGDIIFEESAVARRSISRCSGAVSEEILYENRCRIGYPLPEGTLILDESGGPETARCTGAARL